MCVCVFSWQQHISSSLCLSGYNCTIGASEETKGSAPAPHPQGPLQTFFVSCETLLSMATAISSGPKAPRTGSLQSGHEMMFNWWHLWLFTLLSPSQVQLAYVFIRSFVHSSDLICVPPILSRGGLSREYPKRVAKSSLSPCNSGEY